MLTKLPHHQDLGHCRHRIGEYLVEIDAEKIGPGGQYDAHQKLGHEQPHQRQMLAFYKGNSGHEISGEQWRVKRGHYTTRTTFLSARWSYIAYASAIGQAGYSTPGT